ncbi:MAG TPA: malto-oligosyltrehalose synthase, partial [Chitinophagaceae bacterium]
MAVYNPGCTYRLQFHREFTFADFEKVIAYLRDLGVSTIYASPIFSAMPGSNHGYDGTDANRINPEIGSLEQLKKIAQTLKTENIGWLQDIVPNHMAFASQNPWIADVMENGRASQFAGFFDIDWDKGPLMAPFLGDKLDNVVERMELRLKIQGERIGLTYFDAFFPLNKAGYEKLLSTSGKKFPAITKQLQQLTGQDDGKWDAWRGQLFRGAQLPLTEKLIAEANQNVELLRHIALAQYYRLCHWQETESDINYRRFFTVNALICLNVQDEPVFNAFHGLASDLVNDGIFNGLRIDHIDGLYDPRGYLQRLQGLAGEETYVTVEKILEKGEELPADWSTAGTTGYDFLAVVNNLLTNRGSENELCEFYEDLLNEYIPPDEQLFEKKLQFLQTYMGGELKNLFELLLGLIEKKQMSAIYRKDLEEALATFLSHCPVYRYYGTEMPLVEPDRSAISGIFRQIREEGSDNDAALSVLEQVLLEVPSSATDDYKNKLAHFYRRCMQFTGPLMAKGLEDTLMYTYNNFVGHNEVGDHPANFGIGIDDFHQAMKDRQAKWPLTLNATSTHDTKRGEDFRARLNVLTDIADEWLFTVNEWKDMNRSVKGSDISENDEYFLYQTLAGSYPMPGTGDPKYNERLEKYLQKALREGKVRSNWTKPDEKYESALFDFAKKLLDAKSPFLPRLKEFVARIADFGMINSLVQVLLKFTCPGIPDIYQGCERWDLSFVDPDNRRAVDFRECESMLHSLDDLFERDDMFPLLWQERHTAKVKLWMTSILAKLRREDREFFAQGDYIPLRVKGEHKAHVLAFARKHRENSLIIAVPVNLARLCREQGVQQYHEVDWSDTEIVLPAGAKGKASDVFGKKAWSDSKTFKLQALFKTTPFVVFRTAGIVSQRRAGVLLHITSLPSDFAIGDLGPEAYRFADMLQSAKQSVWQILPVNPVDPAQGNSPYSSISASAGNPLMISPVMLQEDGLLTTDEVNQLKPGPTNHTDFHTAKDIRDKAFDLVWKRLQSSFPESLRKSFDEFRLRESNWLDDYCLYLAAKKQEGGKAWFQWPSALRSRDKAALEEFRSQHHDEIAKNAFIQFIFDRQWRMLRSYCNKKNILLVGDLAYYVSHDSADVWANPHLFKLGPQGEVNAVAGTPPDAFSADGQLWGMPVYDWENSAKGGYRWWLDRLRRNKELFDLVRLDHFRAFSAYWEVPAGESAAKGSWKPGPGSGFFNVVRDELGGLPFIAEDLGEIDDEMLALRDEFQLPGMKVLQFAFDGEVG